MMEGIIDNLKEFGSMVFDGEFMPDSDEEGNLIQSDEPKGEYKKNIKKLVEDGKILRYSMHCQISDNKEWDNSINALRQEAVDRKNEEYYGERYLKIKQCM
jgi:hypothetical protein